VARPKRLLGVLLLVLVGVASVVLAVLAYRADTSGLRRRLAEDVRAVATARYVRPVHAAPVLPGRFGDLAAGPWTALAERQALSTDVEFCRAVRDGETPVEKAPQSCLRELAQGATALAGLLRATHAEAAGPPPGLGALDVPAPAEAPRTFVTAAYAARMAALQMQVALARGEAEAALSMCLDLLALARDASWGTALEGRFAALTVSELAFLPCARALDVAPVSAKRRAAVSLEKLAQGTPPLAETLNEWSVRVRAQRFGRYLSPEALRVLPAGVQAWAHGDGAPAPSSPEEAVALGTAWHALQSRLDAVVEASRLKEDVAEERLAALSTKKESAFAALGRLDFPDLGSVAMSDARVRAELLLLRRAAEVDALRAETGAWPRAEALPEALRPTPGWPLHIEDKGGEAVLTDSASPRGGLELTLHADASGH
jgi:hypothetical protein